VFNATLKNISVISWRSVLLVKETGVYMEKTYFFPFCPIFRIYIWPRFYRQKKHLGCMETMNMTWPISSPLMTYF
jgi:hypothetical protein